MTNDHSEPELLEADDKPPILGSWQALYTLVVVLHFILIGLFYWFTRTYA